jgi:acylphosphatase
MAPKRAHLWIDGLVQGVSFRYYTRHEATCLGLTGWVRNLRDGRVEVVAEGEEDPLKEMIDWCHRGPPHAQVTSVQIRWEPYQGRFDRFAITW